MKKKSFAALMSGIMLAGVLAGCGTGTTASNNQSESATTNTTAAADSTAAAGETVTLKIFSNLPDRKNGQGLVEQQIIDDYMAENQNVKIEVEALDEEAYKTKFKAYAMNGMPDVVSIWGQPSFLDEVLDAGVLAELNEADYKDYKFISGSLEGFKKDGKLYGLPRNTDVQVIYYNQKMFEDNGWKVPSTYDELLKLVADIKGKGITPIAMDGGDGWPMCTFLTDIMAKVAGTNYAKIISESVASGNFDTPEFKRSLEILKELADAGAFQTGYDAQDYGTAMNLFTNGQAAMFAMGSWECSMAKNEDIPEEIRTNIRAFTFPVIDGGQGGANDISAWNGGGYAVAADSKVKDEAIKFLNYMYQPEKLSKYGWENGVGMSAQDQKSYLTGDETELQLSVMDMVNNATSVSGTPINDCGPATFKTAMESEIQSYTNGSEDIDTFIKSIGEACK